MTVKEKLAEYLNTSEAVEEMASKFETWFGAAEKSENTDVAKSGQPSTYLGHSYNSYSAMNLVNSPIVPGVFNGEKKKGELGLPMNIYPDFRALRFRAYEANITSDLVKIITGKFFKWVVGNGLKMQSEPYEDILALEKVTTGLTPEATQKYFTDFKNNVEQYFELWSNSTRSDFSGMENLHVNARKQFETKFLGGDCLIVLRVDEKNNVTTQVIDGQHVTNPVSDRVLMQGATSRGNMIVNGIEIDSKGRHVAFYVNATLVNMAAINSPVPVSLKWERIAAYGETSGCLMAWMAYGTKHRIDHQRGIPNITSILQKVQKMDRYTEATVAQLEERAKIVYTVVHGNNSDGENPFIKTAQSTAGAKVSPTDQNTAGQQIAAQIAISEDRKVYNMPIDSQLKAVSSQTEVNYEPFFKAIFLQLCAAVDIPPEVALQQYNSNYSASRAAINGWGFIIDIYRQNLVRDYYQPIFNLWLYVHVLKGKVEADGYLKGYQEGNADIVEAYSSAKFTGEQMPHIDPVKEMTAIRLALGDDLTPLTTYEEAARQGQFGDWNSNIKKFKQEKAVMKGLDLNFEPEVVPQPDQNVDQGKVKPPK